MGHRRWTPSASLGHLRTGFRSVWPRVRARPCSWRNSALSGFLIFKADAFSSGPGQRVARAPPEWLPSSPKQEGPSPPSCGTRVVAAAWRGARLCYHRRGGPQREGRSLSGLLFAPLLESAVSVHGGTETVCASGWPGPPSAAGTCVREEGEPARAPPGAALLCGPAAHSQLRAKQNRFLAPFIRPAVTTEAPKGKDVTTPTRQARPPVRPDSLHLGRVLSLLLPGPRV